MTTLSRRGLFTGLGALIVSPAVVRAESLMRVAGDTYRFWQISVPILPPLIETPDIDAHIKRYLGPNGYCYVGTWTYFGKTHNVYSDECVSFTKREYGP